jgi:hypothetical protein
VMSFNRVRAWAVALVLIGAPVLAGCGGSSKHRTATATAGVAASATGTNTSGAPTTTGVATTTGASTATGTGGSGGSGSRGSGSRGSGSKSSDPSSSGAVGATGSGVSAATGSTGSSPSGSGTGQGSTPPAAPTFTAQADAICSNYRHQAAGLNQATGLVAQEKVLPRLLHAVDGALARLKGLSAPAGTAASFGRFTANTALAVKLFVRAQIRSRSTNEAVGTAAAAQDMSTYKAAAQAALAARAAARHTGLHVCGSNGSDWL